MTKTIEEFKTVDWKKKVNRTDEGRLYEIVAYVATDPQTLFKYKEPYISMIRCYPDVHKKIEIEAIRNKEPGSYFFFLHIEDCMETASIANVNFGWKDAYKVGGIKRPEHFEMPSDPELGNFLMRFDTLKHEREKLMDGGKGK